MSPALAVFLLTLLFSLVFADGSLSRGLVVGRPILRFLRFGMVLWLPLSVLPSLYRMIIDKGGDALVRVGPVRNLEITPLKHWLLRPLQGIGIGFLFASKLLTVLQLIAGPNIRPSLLIPQGQFDLGRLAMITATTVLVSLLLSIFWTLDDLGIRYHNRKDQELKMMGKYVGTLMPALFGLYGLLNLFSDYPTGDALIYACKIVAVLYPPMVIFTVLHTYFIRRRPELFSGKHLLKRAGVWEE
jgi:hypothetical protein